MQWCGIVQIGRFASHMCLQFTIGSRSALRNVLYNGSFQLEKLNSGITCLPLHKVQFRKPQLCVDFRTLDFIRCQCQCQCRSQYPRSEPFIRMTPSLTTVAHTEEHTRSCFVRLSASTIMVKKVWSPLYWNIFLPTANGQTRYKLECTIPTEERWIKRHLTHWVIGSNWLGPFVAINSASHLYR